MEIIISLMVFLLAFFGMAIGFVIAKKKLTGTCGGLGKLVGACFICDKKNECPTQKQNS